ncbi:unnamed protein product [Candidula unifasciata]|uniref:Uncharacterized protein n=1 Tax=Candidula unifasciata TaxID=100452 RepID=A0A8S3YL89_9EUPU|nr:unnamed protein product [Candidula unifasciata]
MSWWGMPTYLPTSLLLILILLSTGEHEMEFCTGDESELLTKKTFCDKDSTHEEFIPVADFHSGCLPESYREKQDVFDLIQAAIHITVRVVVEETSLDRPEGYTCHKLGRRGGLKRFGSGWVWSSFRSFSTKDKETCPCKECFTNKAVARSQWGQFIVRTAKHVIFDDFEAQHASCELNYDSEDCRGKCDTLLGVEVLMSDIDGDFSEVTFVTHDSDLSRKLEARVSHYRKLFNKLGSKNNAAHDAETQPVVIISHPHGCSKQISIGVVSAERDDYPRNWTYTARTCPGSSGGPVLRLGNWSLLSCVPPHSGSRTLEMNYSSEPWLF